MSESASSHGDNEMDEMVLNGDREAHHGCRDIIILHDSSSDDRQSLSPCSTTSIECPYAPGKRLLLHNDEMDLEACITSVFRGGEQSQFSNSCTVLIHILESPLRPRNGRDMVLKIIDWRYASTLRSYYGCGRWTKERRTELTALSTQDKYEVEEWLCSSMSDTAINHSLVRSLCDLKLLPSQPTNIDLYAHLVTASTEQVLEFFHCGLIPSAITNAHREVFLQKRADLQLAMECSVADTVEHFVPGFMPRVMGQFEVSVEEDEHDAPPIVHTTVAQKTTVPGLLMEHVRGQPIAMINTGDLDDDEVGLLATRMVHFNLQLARCNLQLMDDNLHNFILDYDPGAEHWDLRIVDYGGLSIVGPEVRSSGFVNVKCHGAFRYIQLHKECFSRFFDTETEFVIVRSLIARLARSDSVLRAEFGELLADCFDTHVDLGQDSYVWHTIMLHILHAFNPWTVRDDVETVLAVVRVARRVMVDEYARLSLDPWFERATAQIAKETGNDVQTALRSIRSIVEKLVSRLEGYDIALPLAMLATVGDCNGVIPIFVQTEKMLQFRHGPSYHL